MAAQGASACAPPSLGRAAARRPHVARQLRPCAALNRGGLILPGSDGFPSDYGSGGSVKVGGGLKESVPAGFGPQAARIQTDGGPLYQPFRPPPSYKDTATQGKDDMMRRLSGAWAWRG